MNVDLLVYNQQMELITDTLRDMGRRIRQLEAVEVPVGGGVPAHTILNGAAHSDTVADAVTAGSLIYGNATPAWDELNIGTAQQLLTVVGGFLVWKSFDWDDAAAAAGADMVHNHSSNTEGGEIPLASLGSYTRGDLIVGGAVDWTDLAVGAAGTILYSDGVDPSWQTLSSAGVAPNNATYIVVTLTAALTNERYISIGNGLSALDGGANNAYAIILGTPSTLTVATGNVSGVGTHTHAITNSSDGTASPSTITSFNANGQLTASDYFTNDGGTYGIPANELFTVNGAAGTFDFSGISAVTVENGDWIGKSAVVSILFDDAATPSVDISGTVGIDQFVYHNGDIDTYINFQTDQITIVAGAATMINVVEDIIDYVEFGSQIRIPDYIYHVGDTDTYIYYQTDKVTIVAGAVTMIDIIEDATDEIHLFPAGSGFVGVCTATPTSRLTVSGGTDGSSNWFSIFNNSNDETHKLYVDAGEDGTLDVLSAGEVAANTIRLRANTDAPHIAIGNGGVPTGNNPAISMSRTVTGAINAHGIEDWSNVNLNAALAYASYDARVTMSGANSVDHYNAFQAAQTYSNTNTITWYQSFSSIPNITTGTATNYVHYKVTDVNLSGGSIGTQYGFYITDTLNSAATNWAIYVSGTTASYFGGNISANSDVYINGDLGVGTSSPNRKVEIIAAGGGAGAVQLRLGTSAATYWELGRDQATGNFILADDGLGVVLTILQSNGSTGFNVTSPTAKVDIDQSSGTATIPVLQLDQGDISEPCINFRSDGVDRDIYLWTVGVTGGPYMLWDESQDAYQINKSLLLAEDLYVGLLSTDLRFVFNGSNNSVDFYADTASTGYFRVMDSAGAEIITASTTGILEVGLRLQRLNDTDTYIWMNVADQMGFEIGGATAMTLTEAAGVTIVNICPDGVDSAQYVGIGGLGGASAACAVYQDSGTAAIPVMSMEQVDLSEEFINFVATVGAGYPIDTAAVGTYYGKLRMAVNGTFKYVALYNS